MLPNLLDVGFGMIRMMSCETSLERTDALADQLLGCTTGRQWMSRSNDTDRVKLAPPDTPPGMSDVIVRWPRTAQGLERRERRGPHVVLHVRVVSELGVVRVKELQHRIGSVRSSGWDGE